MKHLTGDDYPHVCAACRAAIDGVALIINELPDEYASDEEGCLMFAGDHKLMCGFGGTACDHRENA